MENELAYALKELVRTASAYDVPIVETGDRRIDTKARLNRLKLQNALVFADTALAKLDGPIREPNYWIIEHEVMGPKIAGTEYEVYTTEPPNAALTDLKDAKLTMCYALEN